MTFFKDVNRKKRATSVLEWGNWSWESQGFAVLSAVQATSLVPQIRDFNGGKQPWCWQMYFQAQLSFAGAW